MKVVNSHTLYVSRGDAVEVRWDEEAPASPKLRSTLNL